jgi:hypothetical protein
MASTISLTGDWMISLGNKRQSFGTGNLGTSATNGIAVTPTQVGLGVIEDLVVDPAAGYVFEYVKATGKVKAYVVNDDGSANPVSGSPLGEVANDTALAGVTFNFRAVGR